MISRYRHRCLCRSPEDRNASPAGDRPRAVVAGGEPATVRTVRSWVLTVALVPALGLAACSAAATPRIDVTRLPRDVQTPFTDAGPAPARAAVRASLVDALTAEEDQLARTEQGEPMSSPAARSARLQRVESKTRATQDLLAPAYLTAADTPFRSSHFTVTAWQGVAVQGDRAKAYVLGQHTYAYWNGTTRGEPEFQYKALLRRAARAPHGWILIAYKAASNEEG